jgi:hypothetical protein
MSTANNVLAVLLSDINILLQRLYYHDGCQLPMPKSAQSPELRAAIERWNKTAAKIKALQEQQTRNGEVLDDLLKGSGYRRNGGYDHSRVSIMETDATMRKRDNERIAERTAAKAEITKLRTEIVEAAALDVPLGAFIPRINDYFTRFKIDRHR